MRPLHPAVAILLLIIGLLNICFMFILSLLCPPLAIYYIGSYCWNNNVHTFKMFDSECIVDGSDSQRMDPKDCYFYKKGTLKALKLSILLTLCGWLPGVLLVWVVIVRFTVWCDDHHPPYNSITGRSGRSFTSSLFA
ncbi:hypothetical protein ABK040_016128 [Willaertia magna]